MSKIIVIVGHPYWKDSAANKAVIEEFRRIIPDVAISNITELYPDGKIDVKAEQNKLLDAETIVLQFPIMWYSFPSVMHRWMEEVLAYGFAYGCGGDRLKGKKLVASFTAGGTADAYSRYGVQRMTVDDMITPIAALPRHCQMQWGGYVFSGGMIYPADGDPDQLATFRGRAKDHARRLVRLLSADCCEK